MYLQTLSLVNFKNIDDTELSLSANLNCFIGSNGAGKTNVMDAIYYLSFCKSFLNSSDSMNIKHHTDFFMIQGIYAQGEQQEQVHCALKRGQKKVFKFNKKECTRLVDHIGRLPLIIISPADNDLISGGSEERRKFIDSLISQYDAAYLNALVRYNKVVQQRNKLLKQFAKERTYHADSLEVWNDQMAIYAQEIHKKRAEYIARIKPIFQKYYQEISQGKELIDMQYKSQLNECDMSQLLEDNSAKDQVLQYSSVGTHRDDIVFKLGDYPLKKLGSQGQKKSYLVAMKLAQFDLVKEMSEQTPILLLDDIFDKLDAQRVEQIMSLVADDHFGQIFISDTNREHLDDIIKKISAESKIFEVEAGKVKQLEHETE